MAVRGSALWLAVQAYQPHLNDQEVDDLLDRVALQERNLVLKHKLNLDQAQEMTREELFPPKPLPADPLL